MHTIGVINSQKINHIFLTTESVHQTAVTAFDYLQVMFLFVMDGYDSLGKKKGTASHQNNVRIYDN